MSFYADLKVKNKLTLGFAIVVLLALAIGIFGYFQIHKLERADMFLFEKGIKPVEHIGDIAADFQRLRVNLREFILATEQNKHDFYNGRIITFREEIDGKVNQLEAALPDSEAKKLFTRLVQTRNDYTPHIDQVMQLSTSGRNDEAMAYLKSPAVDGAEHDEITAIEALQSYLVATAAMIAEQNRVTATITGRVMLALAFGASLLAGIMTLLITRSIVNPLRLVLDAVQAQQAGNQEKAQLVQAIAAGDLSREVIVTEALVLKPEQISRDEAGMLLQAIAGMSEVQASFDQAFAKMTTALRRNREEEARRDWFKNGQNELNTLLRGDQSGAELTKGALAFLTEYLGAGVGVFYLPEDENEGMLKIAASYALPRRAGDQDRIAGDAGLVGQAAQAGKILLHTPPAAYLPITSGLGAADPVNILILPLLHNQTLVGVLEIGSFKNFTPDDLEFLNQTKDGIAIALSVNRSRQRVNELLEETQTQTEELRVQQEELQQTNEELEERAQMLEAQREQIRAKNREVEEGSREIQRKADELERVSTYKSEFLANMSHELRTPLNSLMILSSLLRENREGTLSDKQVEFAATINGAGRDLLHLINDILDLSKIESGHLDFHHEELALADLCGQLESNFQPLTLDKGIAFSVLRDASAPQLITADEQRTRQILNNLLSNACKFTSQGSVLLRAYTPAVEENPLATTAVAFAVTDTGIGIPAEKQSLIFNAFQQADGSTSRTYGGTGLGLSISRQLARSMGGEISLRSEVGQGSTFTLYLPLQQRHNIPPAIPTGPVAVTVPAERQEMTAGTNKSLVPLPTPLPDDREEMQRGDKSILIIEDDLIFAGVLIDMVRGRGFAALMAAEGESGIALAERYQPSAIILDVMLPHLDGWGVMRSLKDNPATRHIPVHFLTCLEERQKALSMGAIGYVRKPVSSEQLAAVIGTMETAIAKIMKMLLIVEDDPGQAQALVALLEEKNVAISVAESGAQAIQLLTSEPFDCIVLDLGLADMGAFALLEELKKLDPQRHIPVIIHTGRELSREDEKRLHHYAESIIIKGAKSPERLLNEVTLFLHLVETSLAPDKQRMIRAVLDKEAMMAGKKILIVDDDMRNIFSLSSALAEKDMIVLEAENGREALKRLDEFPDIDLILMDIMMPEMDGYEAMRAIRQDPRFHSLPIIALTAKAMKGDREECLKVGASDYIPKPVEMGKLFSLLRVWLYSEAVAEATGLR